MFRSSALLLLAVACSEPGPPPSLVADVRTLRAVIAADEAEAHITEAELIASDRRPVRAGDMVEAAALPSARRQVERARDAAVTTREGRAFARRLREAYAERVRGLTVWRRYLEGAATDDDLLLESSTLLRSAQLEILAVDRDMDAVTPTPSAATSTASSP
jgi:hypothetical protein